MHTTQASFFGIDFAGENPRDSLLKNSHEPSQFIKNPTA